MVDDDGRRRTTAPDDGHPISSPCEPNGSGELKTNNLHMQKQRCISAVQATQVDQHLCFRSIDSMMPLLSKSEISNFKQFSVALQPGLCRTGSET